MTSYLPKASPLTEDARAGHKPIVNLCDGPSLPNCYGRKVILGPKSKACKLAATGQKCHFTLPFIPLSAFVTRP